MGFPLCYFCYVGVVYPGLIIASNPGVHSPWHDSKGDNRPDNTLSSTHADLNVWASYHLSTNWVTVRSDPKRTSSQFHFSCAVPSFPYCFLFYTFKLILQTLFSFFICFLFSCTKPTEWTRNIRTHVSALLCHLQGVITQNFKTG